MSKIHLQLTFARTTQLIKDKLLKYLAEEQKILTFGK